MLPDRKKLYCSGNAFLAAMIFIFYSCNKPDNISIPTVITNAVTSITDSSAKSGGNIIEDGGNSILTRGICWSTLPNPSVSNSKTIDGSGTGKFNSVMTGLTDNTTYYVRAYATNVKGSGYGATLTFKTAFGSKYLPALTTTPVSSITDSSANSGGNITSDAGSNVISRGICWSTSQPPTIADHKTTDGMGTGNFSSHLNMLNDTTIYYIRAYGTNANGTGYGNTVSFKTLLRNHKIPNLAISNVLPSPIDAEPLDILYFHIVGTPNSISNIDLSLLKFTATAVPGGILKDTSCFTGSLEKKLITKDIRFQVPASSTAGSAIVIKIKLTDAAAEVYEVTWVLHIIPYLTIYSYKDVTLGSDQNVSYGNFYAAANNLNAVYFPAAGKANCTRVDMCYYYNSVNTATLAAPNDVTAITIYTDSTSGLATWTIRNATKFRKLAILTQAEYDALDANSIKSRYNSAPSTEYSYANSLFDGSGGFDQSFVAFKTVNPLRYGIIQVTEIDEINQAAGYIKFNVKIAK